MKACTYCGRENEDTAFRCSECGTQMQAPQKLETQSLSTLDLLFVGLSHHVVAFNKRDGTQLWKSELRGGFTMGGDSFVTVLAEAERIYAHTLGHLFCLDARTGEHLWSNKLEGLGYGIAMLALVGMSSPSLATLMEQKRKSASQSGAAGGGT